MFQGDLVAAGILSGNRNFEGRVHPNTRANYLASPPLVIAYAIAGTVRIDFEKEPIGEYLYFESNYTHMLVKVNNFVLCYVIKKSKLYAFLSHSNQGQILSRKNYHSLQR